MDQLHSDARVVERKAASFRLSLGMVWLLALAHAGMFALLWPPTNAWPLAFVALVPLAWLAIGTPSTRAAVLAVYIAQIVMWLWLNRWLIDVTVVGYPILGMYLGLYPAIFVWILRRAKHHRAMSRWPMMLIVPLVWVGTEFLRGTVAFDGYPWFLLGQPLINWLAFAQSADLLGTYFMSFIVAFINGAIVEALIAGRLRRPGRIIVACASTLSILLANIIYGHFRVNQAAVLAPGPRILAIQTNLPQSNKLAWTLQQQVEDFQRFSFQTIDAYEDATKDGRPIDLVVWPETMLPGFGFEPQAIEFLRANNYDPGDYFFRGILELRDILKTPLLVGSDTRVNLNVKNEIWVHDERYNSVYLIDADTPPFQRYDKIVLTPYGETMPYISNWPWLERLFLTIGVGADLSFDLSAGKQIARITLKYIDHSERGEDLETFSKAPVSDLSDLRGEETLVIATPICFEDTVAWYCRRLIYDQGHKVAGAFINLSNDGWFNRSDADRRLHAQLARFRCIENRVPMIRCVNTGVSISIDSCGRIVESVGAGDSLGNAYGTPQRAGHIVDRIVLDSRHTLFARVGELFPWLCLSITAAMMIATFIHRAQHTE